jgi:hypothetical protein
MSLAWRTTRLHATLVWGGARALLCMLILIVMGWPQPATAIEAEYGNFDGISIPDSGDATPYPSTVTVAGVTGTITNVAADIFNLSHTFPGDIQILLVGPTGANVVLMANCCNDSDAVDVDLTFDDAAASQLPTSETGPVQR